MIQVWITQILYQKIKQILFQKCESHCNELILQPFHQGLYYDKYFFCFPNNFTKVGIALDICTMSSYFVVGKSLRSQASFVNLPCIIAYSDLEMLHYNIWRAWDLTVVLPLHAGLIDWILEISQRRLLALSTIGIWHIWRWKQVYLILNRDTLRWHQILKTSSISHHQVWKWS